MTTQPVTTQRGMAMVVGLIMLALMTVICLASFNLGRTSMDIIGNMQRRAEVTASANSAIETALSTKRLFQQPTNIFATPCGAQNTICFDLNNDGVNDISVALTPAPTCLQQQPIPNSNLKPTDTEDRGCIQGDPDNWASGIPPGDSLCANTVWEINAVAQDTVTAASITVTEGAAVRVAKTDVATNCP